MNTQVLQYLAEQSGIPVWIVGDGGNVIFSSVVESYRKHDDDSAAFFRWVYQNAQNDVQIRRINENDLTASFSIDEGNGRLAVLIGPAYELHPLDQKERSILSLHVLLKPDCVKLHLLSLSPVTVAAFCRFATALSCIVRNTDWREQSSADEIKGYALADIVDTQLTETIFDLREEAQIPAYAPDAEKRIMGYVTAGDTDAIEKFKAPTVKAPYAQNTRHQNLFEAVALVTLATRAAIAGGVDYVVAFSLSDMYFKRLSDAVNDKQIAYIEKQALMHFTRQVRDSKREDNPAYSPYINRAIVYIRANLHFAVSLEEVANELKISPKYLSRIFITCTGEKFSTFVQKERIREAKNLLENTDRSIVDISYSLGFSSQSYFIKVFREHTGMTPNRFMLERGCKR